MAKATTATLATARIESSVLSQPPLYNGSHRFAVREGECPRESLTKELSQPLTLAPPDGGTG
jgi:hypothetical protein